MKILIIGGSGYIGTHLVDYIKNFYKKYEIFVIDSHYYPISLKKYKDIKYIHNKYQDLPREFYKQFTDIILLAGQASINTSKNILNVIDNNIRNFVWLVDILTDNQKLIYASSSSVYGQTYDVEITEDYDKICEPINYYDWSKQAIDNLTKLSKKHIYSLRLGTINGFSRNLRNDLMINKMINDIKKNGTFFVSNKHIYRSILGINDLCKAIVTIMEKGKKELSGIYNLSSFHSNVNNIANKVSEICQVQYKFIDTSDTEERSENIYNFKCSSNKFIKTFQFQFEETLESIIYDLLNNWCKIENLDKRSKDNYIKFKMIKECHICDNETKSLLDLGYQPLANNYIQFKSDIEKTYPLHLHYCPRCYHTQLNCVVNPEILFRNYLYISGTSTTLKDYFENFVKNIITKDHFNRNSVIKILDIACNDGSQLDACQNILTKIFPNKKIITVGVDPAENIYNEITSDKVHDIYCDFFNNNITQILKSKYKTFDIIIAQNVFAHVSYPKQFLAYTKDLMNDTSFLYIQTSQKNMILTNQFDTIYHEHLSFFNTNSMKLLCDKNDMILNNVYEHEIHGTSYIFEITKVKYDKSNTVDILKKETLNGLYDKDTYSKYKLKCIEYKNKFMNKLIYYKLKNSTIIAYGSTAKSMTIFNFCNITDEMIDKMIDENKLKQNLYTPGSKLYVYSINALEEIKQLEKTGKYIVILITAWNFYNEIKHKIKTELNKYNISIPITLLNINSLEEEII